MVIPPLTNRTIAITKYTAIASVVSVPEILNQASMQQAQLANPTPLTLAAILYTLTPADGGLPVISNAGTAGGADDGPDHLVYFSLGVLRRSLPFSAAWPHPHLWLTLAIVPLAMLAGLVVAMLPTWCGCSTMPSSSIWMFRASAAGADLFTSSACRSRASASPNSPPRPRLDAQRRRLFRRDSAPASPRSRAASRRRFRPASGRCRRWPMSCYRRRAQRAGAATGNVIEARRGDSLASVVAMPSAGSARIAQGATYNATPPCRGADLSGAAVAVRARPRGSSAASPNADHQSRVRHARLYRRSRRSTRHHRGQAAARTASWRRSTRRRAPCMAAAR